MKICLVSRGWPSDNDPQWGSFESDQAKALAKKGHKIVVLSVDSRFRFAFRKERITEGNPDKISIYNMAAGPFVGKLLRKISLSLHLKVKNLLMLRLFKKVLKKEGMPDIMYTHYLGNTSMGVAIKKKYGIPVVGIEHWSELGYDNIDINIKRWAEKTYSEIDLLLTVSSALRNNILVHFGVDSIVVNNMVGDEFVYSPHSRSEDKMIFVTAGNLIPRKGFDLLITAFHHANLNKGLWTLNIVGDGPEHDKLDRMIKEYGLNDNIHLLGRKDRTGVVKELHRSDVYILSSLSETFGVAAIEAMACGLPVIVTDCGGTKDFITEKNGLICPPADVQKLSERIIQMFYNYNDYNRKEISDDCLSRFSSGAIARQLTGLFESVLQKKG